MNFLKISLLLVALSTQLPFAGKCQTSLASIIQNTEDAYANATKYVDSGKVITTIYNAKGIVPTSFAHCFRIAYSSSGLFNFEFYKVGQSNSLYIINRDQLGSIKNWWGINNRTKAYTELDLALKEAQGVSTLTSTMIPKFLFTKSGTLGMNIFKEMQDIILNQPEGVKGIQCYKMTGRYKDGTAIIWVGQEDFLIRKVNIDQTIKSIGFLNEYFITPYESSGNSEFNFKPNRAVKL